MAGEESVKSALVKRQQDYQHTFRLENRAITDEGVRAVLKDLQTFCRADSTCFHADPRVHAALEGRREVYLRIMDHLKLSTKELQSKYHYQNSEED